MTILSAEQIREWDQYTISNEPISSIDLMERAAQKCVSWIERMAWEPLAFKIFCGKGNNGGDGLAIARMLHNSGYNVSVYILEFGKIGTEDFQTNLNKLHHLPVQIHYIQNKETIPYIEKKDIIIDALFGSGLHGPLKDLSADLVNHINKAKTIVVSIDLPSGLFADQSSKGNSVIEAGYTLSFQCYKPALLMQENALYIGIVNILDIELKKEFLSTITTSYNFITPEEIKKIFKPRPAFGHKGTFGHALLITGSFGKMGAAVLCTKSCLRSGVGLVTALIPNCGYNILQIAAPEAMVIPDENEKYIAGLPDDIEQYAALGVGPGLGTDDETKKLVSFIIRRSQRPLILDADALNCVAAQPELLQQIPRDTILTPHPKEFDRLFGDHSNDFERVKKAREKAMELHIIIVLKGHHTVISTPAGQQYFNNTGNSGLAKGGSGDVLTGIITGLKAQGYQSVEAAITGVYIHGLAGDIGATELSEEAMTPQDIINYLPQAFLKIKN